MSTCLRSDSDVRLECETLDGLRGGGVGRQLFAMRCRSRGAVSSIR